MKIFALVMRKMKLHFTVCLARITLDLSTGCCSIFYWIQYWNHCLWFIRSRCLLKNFIGWFLVWYPFRYICYSSDSYRCWWCQLWKQCQSGVQHPSGTAVFLSGSRNRLVIHQSYFLQWQLQEAGIKKLFTCIYIVEQAYGIT